VLTSPALRGVAALLSSRVLEEAGGFLPFVFDPVAGRGQQMRQAMRRYAGFLPRSHSGDEPIG
jgi:hypothetical protein